MRVRGKRSGESVVLATGGSVETLSTSADTNAGSDSGTESAVTAARAAGVTKRVAVLLMNFTSPTTSTPPPSPDPSASPTPTPSPTASPAPPPEPWTKSFVRGVYFTNTKSVAAYFGEVSNSKLALTGDVFGYFTIAAKTSSCNYADWGTAARQAATAAGINLSSYDHVVHAFGRISACPWGGMAQVYGRYNWINGAMTPYVTIHELGHNLGVHHAASMTCTQSGTRVTLSSSCTTAEYGDPFDVMGQDASGGSKQRHVQAWHRRQLGFLTTADQLTVTQNGQYTVSTAQVAGGSPRILRIPRPSGDFYYLELRQPYGMFDDFSTTAPVVGGVLVRIAPDTKRIQSKLLDMNPSTSGFSDAALAVGRTFTDSANKISITTVSVSSTGAIVRIQVGADSVPPTTPGSLTATAGTGGSIQLSWTASTDDVALKGYRVSRDGAVLKTVTPDTLTYSDTNLTQGVTYTYSVAAVDTSNNVSAPAVVSRQLPDTTPPSAPTNVTAVKTGPRTVSLSWTAATDNGVVAGYRVRRDGVRLADPTGTSFVDSTVVDGYSYRYEVRAVDAAGNLGPVTAAVPSPISLPDVTPPTAPGSASLVAPTSTSTSLSWTPATDNVAVTGYRVLRDGVAVKTLAASVTSFGETSLKAGTYQYAVVAFDAAGNVGPPFALSVTLSAPDTTPPSVPQKLTAKALDNRYVSLSWQASTDDRAGTISYRILRDGVRIATVTGTTFTDRPSSVGTYSYKVRAVDEAGNRSAFSTTVGVRAVTSLAATPSVPTNLKGTSLDRRYVQLTWGASTGGTGSIRYRVFRNGVRIATVSTTSFRDRPASVGTYSYKVRAIDSAGNKSPFTPEIRVRAVRAV